MTGSSSVTTRPGRPSSKCDSDDTHAPPRGPAYGERMARKKTNETTTYLVMVHSDGRPTQVILPDGRMAILIQQYDLYPCTEVSTFTGVVSKKKSGKVEIYGEDGESVEDIKEGLIFDGHDPRTVKALKLEHHPLVSFG
jgi:hypothetical protein